MSGGSTSARTAAGSSALMLGIDKRDSRQAADLGGARLEWIDDSYTFASEDQPERLAELIASFCREPGRAAA